MVQAILDGRKTVTRRVLKNQNYIADNKQPYRKGDILYVRETWAKDSFGHYVYKTDYEGTTLSPDWKWQPSIHMPKEAARIWLKVTDIRVERLQDITEEQAKAEGAIDNRGFIHSSENEHNVIHTAREHFMRIWNSTLKIYNKEQYGWDANPWVWLIEFERCEKPKEVK